ncbi:RNA polymerase II Mediator complex subunit Sin4 [Blastomyces dermatitidis ER-3]|uniref:Mediator of RNA polymerase II transcription subunit 16 n=1 Tax=Ajellomyces dermatitidis (strain ER-3 / ATCC MYA-2586) TaxID=559297 RepID=A0ABP2F476_AJEDR|nr:RNA polymerase II Mediator complex subunit Sin4 [Blastomyces dermatitidis ER-3]EEQ90336.2 RNA polymerase II Mediator complex subunit Sin4 [Blastomyces dermatitidis ER-3]
MPMIMEDSIDVDDLFGDPTSLELGLEGAAPTIKGLPQRLDELRLSGCSQKIAWSKLGAIAYVSQDGQKVLLRCLHCRPDNGKWTLSEESPINQIVDIHGGHTVVHLLWNESGSELAIVDSCGRIAIVTIMMSLNTVNQPRQASIDPDDDLAQPVGLMWLNLNRPLFGFHKATRTNNNRWNYPAYRRRPLGPLHPVNKSALVMVTKSGYIKLIYQNPDLRWGEISSELKTVGYLDGLLTHAALAPAEGSGISIATHSACGKVCFYRVQVKWDPPEWDQTIKPGGGSIAFPTPAFQVLHTKTEVLSAVFHPPAHDMDNITGFSPPNGAIYNLTHLEIITAPQLLPSTQAATGPCILAVASISPQNQLGQPPPCGLSSVLVRWQLDTMAQALHPSFDDVVSKKTASNPKSKIIFRRLDDIYFERYVVSIDYTEASSVLAITHDDSSISFFEARSMRPITENEDGNTVTSMPNAGFTFPIDASGLHIAFSPSGCIAAVLDGEGQFHLRYMEHSFGMEDGMYDSGKFTCAIAALALGYVRACGSDASADDILAVIVRQLNPDAQRTFVTEVYSILFTSVDFTEHDKLVNNQSIQKGLSMQAVLGFRSRFQPRAPSSTVSWIILNIRQIMVLLLTVSHYLKNGKDSTPSEPEVLRMVLGNVKWILDLAKYLVDDLLEIADTIPADRTSFTLSSKTYESPSLILVLSSIPRSFLRHIFRYLGRFPLTFKAANNLSGESYQLFASINDTIDQSSLKPDVCEKMLAHIDSIVTRTYEAAGFGSAERNAPEREMLITCSIPPVLQPAVMSILTETVPLVVRPGVERMALALYDYSWLGIGDDKRTELFKRTHDVDILKKNVGKVLDATVAKRRCVRCCEVSEDTCLPRSASMYRLIGKIGVLRTCVCGGSFAMENVEALDRVSLPVYR